jgi:hypothetical protein
VPPPTTTLLGVYGTYGPEHGLARDTYLGYSDEEVQWGPHDSIPLIAPTSGTVTLYQFPTPLGVLETMSAGYQKAHHDLFDGWVCQIPIDKYNASNVNPLAQVMNVAVFVPDTPISSSRGVIRALWFGHIRNGTRQGHMNAGDKFGESGASGIQFERAGVLYARAAHVHACASVTGNLTPNGDVDGAVACEIMGWKVTNVGFVPGPNQYFTGNYCAGRLLSDFRNASKPIPRMAPD